MSQLSITPTPRVKVYVIERKELLSTFNKRAFYTIPLPFCRGI